MTGTGETARLFEGVLSADAIRISAPMSEYTTFKTGGCADILLSPSSIDEIKNIIDICNKNKLDCIVIGNGSNLLVGDKGIRGVVIRLGREFAGIDIEETQIRVQAGALLSAVANTALKESLCGMEFAAGIPGTIGGAVCMNAGAYGGEMKDIIREVTVLYNGEVVTLSNEQSGFEYRNSTIMQKGMIVLETVIDLSKGSYDDIKAVMDDYSQRRRSKQPLDKPSAGSTFKRPEGHFAGKLIEDAGLKGFGIGGAQVSEKHCGFVVNTGGATSADILRLIDAVKARVYEASGVMLEPEVRMIGEF
jgi:UDP-N-acetylmuramate dehydrogenase